MKDVIYLNSWKYAIEHGEIDAYRVSRKRNMECAAAIDKAIADCNHELYHYDLPEALESVTKDFGLERVSFVSAAAVRFFDSDGRISHTNKVWARDFNIPDENDSSIHPHHVHPVVFDGFVDEVRKAQLHEQSQSMDK